jgi:hypothetical protein
MEEKKENSAQNSDQSSNPPDSRTMCSDFEKVSQMNSILLGLGTILSVILTPVTIISYSNAINSPFLLPLMFSTVSFKMIPFFIGLIIIIILLPVFAGIYAVFIVESTEKNRCKLYFKTAGTALLISIPLSIVYIIPYEFLARVVIKPTHSLLSLLLPLLIAVLTSIIWRCDLERKKLSREDKSGSSVKSFFDKVPYRIILILIFIALLTAAQPFFANGFFRWMGYGDLVVEIVEIDSEGKMKDTVKGCLLFNSGKEIYVQLNSPVQPSSSQPNSSCSSQGQPSEWVMIRFADKLGVDYLSQKDSGSIVRIPYKDIINFEPYPTKAMSPPK